MDKTLLKNFAKESRKDLTQKIAVKISSYFVEDDFKEEIKGDVVVLSNSAHNLTVTRDKYEKRKVLITRIKELGINQVIEEASYTWFNRFVAIRYMEISNMLPLTKDNESLNIRVLSSIDNKLDPEIMSYSNITNPELDLKINKDQYSELKSDNEKFEYILLKVCEKLGKVIPQVFDGVTDYINILSPHNLLTEESVVGKLISIPEENFRDVEVIGWLYQYYISEQKDLTFADLKKNIKVSKENIPSITQIFTPDWIVKYMVENSLGKTWVENTNNVQIKENWKYYIEDAEQEPGVKEELDKLKNPNLNPKDITFIDPCSGSGHILVYAFEVLYQIYESYGFNKREIPKLILENNIYGLDIDDRAGQLSILSLLLKARSFDKELFKKDIKLNVYSIQESNYINESVLYDIRSKETNEIIDYVLEVFKDAKEYGSILKIEKKNYKLIIDKVNQVETLFRKELAEKFIPLLEQAIVLSNKYDIVVTNPPYMGSRGMSELLSKFAQQNYPYSKLDLSTMFMERNLLFSKKRGYVSMINIPVWMNVVKYEKLRYILFKSASLTSLLYFGRGVFGSDFGSVSFVIRNIENDEFNIVYKELYKEAGKIDSVEEKMKMFFENRKVSNIKLKELKIIPGFPISCSISKKMIKSFEENPNISKKADVITGITTGDNDLFLKLWYEVQMPKIGLNYKNIDMLVSNNKKFIPYNKGGDNRKWYGNNEYVVDWTKKELFNRSKKTMEHYYLKEGLTWSFFSFASFSLRYFPEGFLWDVMGSPLFAFNEEDKYKILALLNSKVGNSFLKVINPTIAFQANDIQKVPYVEKLSSSDKINDLVKENILLAKNDWDLFETSWDFKKHPLLKYNSLNTLKSSMLELDDNLNKNYEKIISNEEKLNEIIIELYDMKNEMDKAIDKRFISLNVVDNARNIKSLISYAVGCMFGRYSLDQDGLVYAGGEFDNSKYITFKADKDNVIPINDNNYFMDDIVVKFKEFIKVAFGEEKLHENLEYIADVLGKRNTETSEDTIRRYFINDFYKDHLKTYKKKPIYWLFDSGKANGFKCLIYMHRYEENLAAKIRIDYLHKIQRVFEKELDEVKYKLTGELSPNERKEAMNLQKDLSNKLTEIKEYNENLDHIANQKINIDLDDGVTVNYAKFESVLAKIK